MIASLSYPWRQRIRVVFGNSLYELSGSIFNFILSVFIIRFYDQGLWGAYTQLVLVMMLLNMVISWGNKEYLVREFSRTSRFDQLWQQSLQTRLLFFVLVIPAVLIVPVFPNPWIVVAWLFATYLLRSFDSVVLFERKFKIALTIELTGFLLLALILYIGRDGMNLSYLAAASAGVTLAKAVAWAIVFRKKLIESWSGSFDREYLLHSLPFFLPAFIGFLQSKAGTFIVAVSLSKEELGTYYLLLSLMSYCHVFAVLAIAPFLKNIYRMSSESIRKTRTAFILIGLPWSMICIIGIYGVLEIVYRIQLPVMYYVIAWLALPPYFVYYLIIQELIRNDKPYTVVKMNLIMAVTSFVVGYFLIRQWGFVGGLLTSVCMQWLLMIGYFLIRQRTLQTAHG